MPESPEVDVLAGFLRRRITGRTIRSTELEEFRVLKTRDRSLGELEGHAVTGIRRFGKHVAVDTDGPTLLISLGKAGWATWADVAESDPMVTHGTSSAPVLARVDFDDGGELALTDAGEWLSLGLSIVDDVSSHPSIAKLGVDPTAPEFSREALDRVVVGRRKQLKALLQEQESLAGIGNAYSDEILHAARLSPIIPAAALDEDDGSRLHAAIRDVLGEAFAARSGVPIDQQKSAKVASMRVHGRAGQACPVCGDLVRDVPGSRGAAQYCPTCQTGGDPLE